jgi:protein phosphatase
MGGHAAGEVASALALETLVSALEDGEGLVAAFRLANERVHTGGAEPGKEGMGTTLVALLLDGDEYMTANVGDSRGYQVSSDGIRQLTEDHSFIAEAIK